MYEGVYGDAVLPELAVPASFVIVAGVVPALESVIAIAVASTPAAPMLRPAAITRPRLLSFRRWLISTILPLLVEGNLRIL